MSETELSTRYLASIVVSSDDAIIGKNSEGIITSWNTGAERIYGYSAQEIIGAPISVLIPPEQPNDFPLIMSKIRNGERIEHYETIRQRKDGTRLHVSLTISPIRDHYGAVIGASAIARDITDYKRTEAALRQSEEQFRQLVETAPGAILIIDVSGYIVRVNDRANVIFGYENDELIGLSVEILLPEQFRAVHTHHRDGYFAQPDVRMMGHGRELWARNKDGTQFPVEIGLSYIYASQGMLAVAFVTDITARKLAEDERLESVLREQFATERSRYEERERIAMELHDGIIQSIYAIGMGLEIARTTVSEQSLNAVIGRSTSDLDKVIDDLRHYIHDLNAGLNYATEFQQRLGEIVGKFREICSAKLIVDVPASFNFFPEAYTHALIQIVRESLSNIARHARATEVHLALNESSNQIALTVIDNGVGYDVNSVNLGRGLNNIRHRVERLNGTINVVSQLAKGTTVTIVFRNQP